MYYFAIDFGCEMPYPLAPPQGGKWFLIFENKQLANSTWQLAKTATLCRLGVTQGSPKGHARVTQAPPKGHARATQASIGGSTFVYNKGQKKAGWGTKRSGDLVIAGDPVIGKRESWR
jgi:hypothetical protein